MKLLEFFLEATLSMRLSRIGELISLIDSGRAPPKKFPDSIIF